VLVEAMDVLQTRGTGRTGTRRADGPDPRLGHLCQPERLGWRQPEGDITLVEFMDYRCGYCRKAHDEVKELVESDGNIRYVIKEFPILGEASLLSSQFAIAVRLLHGDDAYKAAPMTR
jgi:protein-disulfide isomerase